MSYLINKLARLEIINIIPYQSARRILSIGLNEPSSSKAWLNANEASGDGEYNVSGKNINRYPDFQPMSLLTAYSSYCTLPKEKILATRGADEGIDLIIRAFCTAYQDSILICPPTYGMYAISAESHGANIIKIPLIRNQLDITSLKKQVNKVKVVFLCSPGNPTGNILPKSQIIEAINLFENSAIVVVDEAYIEYSPENTMVEHLKKFNNLIILRTLSKAFALAGLRCGFTLANSDIIMLLSKIIVPYPISSPVAEIASNELKSSLLTMKRRVSRTILLREELSKWLDKQPWCSEVFFSDANFILFRCINTNEKTRIFDLLLKNKILIRDQSKQIQLDKCLRISIGSEKEIEQLKEVLL